MGKSTLINTLLGKERVIVTAIPGTTRDAIDTPVDFEGQSMLLIDTAGIKRRGRVGVRVARYSVIQALRAIDRADIALLVVDATELLAAQDKHIMGYVQQAAKGIILVVNKCDLVPADDAIKKEKYIRRRLRFMPYTPVLFISAKFGEEVGKIMPQIVEVYKERQKRLPTNLVNNLVQEAVGAHNMPRRGSKRLKILYATQAGINPPTFVFFVNDTKLMHFSYRRYLENKIRQSFGFTGTPIHLVFKARGES